jgi:hypothetical protein
MSTAPARGLTIVVVRLGWLGINMQAEPPHIELAGAAAQASIET